MEPCSAQIFILKLNTYSLITIKMLYPNLLNCKEKETLIQFKNANNYSKQKVYNL